MKFDSDSSALDKRISANLNALYHLEEWISKQILFKESMYVLDIGSGTGKQAFFLQEKLSESSQILATDVSVESLSKIDKYAEQSGIHNIETRVIDHDDILSELAEMKFDLIISTYSIYYAKDMVGIIKALSKLLNSRGQAFMVGNGRGSNREMYKLLSEETGEEVVGPEFTADFLEDADISTISKNYQSHSLHRLENKVYFQSAESLYTWWQNHNSFDPNVSQKVKNRLYTHFQMSPRFELTKNVLGVKYQL